MNRKIQCQVRYASGRGCKLTAEFATGGRKVCFRHLPAAVKENVDQDGLVSVEVLL